MAELKIYPKYVTAKTRGKNTLHVGPEVIKWYAEKCIIILSQIAKVPGAVLL